MFNAKTLPELARSYRDETLTAEEIAKIYGGDDMETTGGSDCVPGKTNTETCTPGKGCRDDGQDCW